MLKDRILRCSSRSHTCKLLTIVGGVTVQAFAVAEKLVALTPILWVSAPLALCWAMDVGYVAEQRRSLDLLEDGQDKADLSCVPRGGDGDSIIRFLRAFISVSTWPFYVALLALISFGGGQIAKANRDTAAQTLRNPPLATRIPASFPPVNPPFAPVRSANAPPSFNQGKLPTQRLTPAPFSTAPHFPTPKRPTALTP
ncbi:hypothetical protein CfE428DRAFT_4689 [Chthoniobacter flavus Ellin428]|uniref:Uncharacterized protein n=1 Tax=Chthoniobacter flavus Ellin428 TaxID=497964 RepID=B4D6Z9_9BACT|nr:hypothetical protein CfE428DRAFT_4689 [Chthoniobacter flavus Ellin428]TCO88556.1 hypothetical protein EV701_117159 [Chthoniobacter flavus]